MIFIFGLIIQCLDQNIVFNHLNEKFKLVEEINMILMLNYIQEKNNF